MRLLWKVIGAAAAAVVAVLRGLFALVHFAGRARHVIKDVVAARRSYYDGLMHCPRGHAFPLEGEVYTCRSCGYTYLGSILKCGNPECGATTSYVDCPRCSLSCRSPFRVGKP